MRKKLLLIASALLCSSALASANTEGVLNIATIGEPPTLDVMQTPTDIILTIDQHIVDTLFTYDEQWRSVPLLAADMPDISEDGIQYRNPIRESVKVHDGSN